MRGAAWLRPLLRDGGKEGFGGRAPEVVEDDVDAVGCELVSEGGGEGFGRLVEADDGVGAEGGELGEGLRVAAGGNDAASSSGLGDLHGELAGDAGGAEDEDAFARLELGAHEGDGGGHGGVGDGGGGRVGDRVGDGDEHGAGGDGLLGEGAEGWARAAEEDAGAGGELAEGGCEAANAVDAGDEGKNAGAAVVRTVGERFDDAVKGGGGDVDEDFAGFGAGDGVVEGGVDGWGVEGLDNGSVHGSLRNDLDFNCTGADCSVMMVARDVGPEVHDGWIDADSERAV